MLQRAASNAYSWWWASHIRTKQSKWLEQNLQDMEEKVKYMLKLVEGEGDTFAKRAEIYFRQRPELIIFVEEAYRAYRALAERYDHISGELQSANNTIATVFPEQIQYAMDEDDEGYDGSPRYPPRPVDQVKLPNDLPEPPKTMPKALSFQMSIKKTPKMAPPTPTTIAAPKSNLSKSEAFELMDKLQKEILALQTEKEFVKSSYESRLARYLEIENRVTEVQGKVCNLQDEFSMSNVIDDGEARTLMASTALKSCQDTLVQLQETHGRSAEEARIENHRVKVAQEKVEALKKKFRHEQMKRWNPFASDEDFMNDGSTFDEEVDVLRQEDIEAEAMVKSIRERLERESTSSLTATEMAEKIDELAKKVITLETKVSSPPGLINRLRLEIDELQECLKSSEGDEAKSNSLEVKLGESEEKLHGIQDLNRNIEYQSNNLRTEFTEARCNVDHLLEKLHSMQHLDDDETVTMGYEKEEVEQILSPYQQFNFEELNVTATSDPANVIDNMSIITFNDLSQKDEELNLFNEGLKQDLSFADFDGKEEIQEKEDEPNWQQLFMNGLEGREKTLLAEYTSVLRNFKETKKQLSDMEKKNLDIISETAAKLQELQNSNDMKDEEIRLLRQELSLLQTQSDDNVSDSAFDDLRNSTATNPKHEGLKFYQDQAAVSMVKRNKSIAFRAKGDEVEEGKRKELNIILLDEHLILSSTEEKFRRSIDELLEENLEFWLRFSTSFHQIQKFQTVIQDLQAEFVDLTAKNKQDDGSSPSKTTSSDKTQKSRARPLYIHLREIQTELDTWVEQSVSLKAELKSRFTSLCDIQEEISEALKAGVESEDMEFTSYQAAKFQGEILNMKQENNKVADELQTGLDFVTGYQLEVEATLTKMNDEFKLSGSKKDQIDTKQSLRSRIPLRSFIFGIKQKKQKPSVFACINPSYQKQYSDLKGHHIPL